MSIYDSVILATAIVITVYQSTEEGMIFESLHKYKSIWYLKPVIGCPTCMGWWYGIAVSLASGFTWQSILCGFLTLALCEVYSCLLSLTYNKQKSPLVEFWRVDSIDERGNNYVTPINIDVTKIYKTEPKGDNYIINNEIEVRETKQSLENKINEYYNH